MRTRRLTWLLLFAVVYVVPATVRATQIWIKTHPGEVNVQMDGIELGQTFGDGSLKPFDLPPGSHVFVFTKEGWSRDEQKIEVSGDQLDVKSTLEDLAELKRLEDEKRKAEDEARRKAEEERRKAETKNLAAIKVETNVGKGGEVYWGTELIGLTNDFGVASRDGLKPGSAKLVVKAKGYITSSQPHIRLKSGQVNAFEMKLALDDAAIAQQASQRTSAQRRVVWLAVAFGGFLLIVAAVLLLVLSGRRRGPEAYLSTGTGVPTTGTNGAPGLFTTPAGSAGDQPELNVLLESSDNLEVLVGKRILGDYLIKSKIGQGGMGAILLANQESLDRLTALKIILPKFAANENVVKRFFREVKLTSKLVHPNIVTIYNFGKSREGILFVAMEYLDGSGLDSILKRSGPMPAQRALPIVAQIASALAEAHGKGVVHRDLKPSNVMLVKRGGMADFAKVLDFGIAKSIEEQGEDEPQLTMSGQILGTPAYMSPEQCSGKPLDARTDIYALGVIAFELLSGKKPFMAESAIGFLQQHLMTPPPKLSAYLGNGQVPADADKVFDKVLAKLAEQRYPRALEFARDLGHAYGIQLNIPGL